MYLDHFKLTDFPFLQSGKDELYFVTSPARKQILRIQHWLDCGHDFLLVTGVEGCGRASLVQHALAQAELDTHVITVGGLVLDDVEFLHYIALELGLTPDRIDSMTLRHTIKSHLKSRASQASRVCLVIRQAELRPESQLHLLRDLARDPDFYLPLCSVVLVAGPAHARDCARLIREQPGGSLHCQIPVAPLTRTMTRQYLDYRWGLVQQAETTECEQSIPEEVSTEIHARSGGNVAAINRLVDHALMAAWSERKPALALNHIADAAKALGWKKKTRRTAPTARPSIKVSRRSQAVTTKRAVTPVPTVGSAASAEAPAHEPQIHKLMRDVTTIGRAADCSIRLPQQEISPCQALIVKTPDGHFVRNEGGELPVMLNSEPITSAALRPGDSLRIGDYELSMTESSDGTPALVSVVTQESAAQAPG